jgi:hypothetical protein
MMMMVIPTYLGDVGIDWMIILKRAFRSRAWTGFNWLMTGFSGKLL